jgi:hypothetical protein
MSDDLAAQLTLAHRRLRQMRDAWSMAWDLHLDYGPHGMDYTPRIRASAGLSRPLPIPLTPDGHPAPTALSRAYNASVRQLRHAVVAASELSWIPDDVAQAAVLPDRERIADDRRTHITLAAGQKMAREVRLAIEGARWRLPLDVADSVHALTLCEQVRASLDCMPDELVHDARGRRVCAGSPLAPPCTNVIPRTHNRCPTCRQRVSRAKQADPDQRSA